MIRPDREPLPWYADPDVQARSDIQVEYQHYTELGIRPCGYCMDMRVGGCGSSASWMARGRAWCRQRWRHRALKLVGSKQIQAVQLAQVVQLSNSTYMNRTLS